MKEKIKSFFDSLWFNALMSVVAVIVLVESVVEQSYVFVILWLVLVCHFIRATTIAAKKR